MRCPNCLVEADVRTEVTKNKVLIVECVNCGNYCKFDVSLKPGDIAAGRKVAATLEESKQ